MEDVPGPKDDVHKWFGVHQQICLSKYIQFDVYDFPLSWKLKKLYFASIRNTSWLWRMSLTPGVEIGNPEWIQCDVPDHTFNVEKDWGWFLYPALRYRLTISTGANCQLLNLRKSASLMQVHSQLLTQSVLNIQSWPFGPAKNWPWLGSPLACWNYKYNCLTPILILRVSLILLILVWYLFSWLASYWLVTFSNSALDEARQVCFQF